MTIKFPTANEIRNSMPTQEELLRKEQEEIDDMMRLYIIPTIDMCAKANKHSVVFSTRVNKCTSLLRALGYTVDEVNDFTEVSW